tara:strand:+ start:67 stop:399 length:333 start_codon:yes stop_codon:yes gene_type:complete
MKKDTRKKGIKKPKKKSVKKMQQKIKKILENASRTVERRKTTIKQKKQKLLKQKKQKLLEQIYSNNLIELDNYYNKYPNQYNKLLKCKTVKKIINGKNSRGYVVEQVCTS